MSGHINAAKLPAKYAALGILVAKIEKIVWKADDIGGAVICKTSHGSVKCDVGSGEIFEGESYKFYGTYGEHPKYGRQFVATAFLPPDPDGKTGTIKYLMEVCPGIGKVTAERLWDSSLTNAVKWLREHPLGYVEAGMMSMDVAEIASTALKFDEKNQEAKIELFDLFGSRGFGGQAIRACLARWGPRAAKLIRKNPWLLLLGGIPRSGFIRVDRLYQDLGGDPASLKRQAIAGWDFLRQADNGSVWLPKQFFYAGVMRSVADKFALPDEALALAIRSNLVRLSKEFEPDLWVADPYLEASERLLSESLSTLTDSGQARWPCFLEGELSDHQSEQFSKISKSRFAILTGGPGTGKTHLSVALVNAIVDDFGAASVKVVAPTGKAASRFGSMLSRKKIPVFPSTIHAAIGAGISDNGKEDERSLLLGAGALQCEYLIVDEVSMCDVALAAKLMMSIPKGAHVLLVGDDGQLPSVGPGAVLRDLIAAGVPRAHLEEMQRSAGMINESCKQIRDGRVPEFAPKLDLSKGLNLRLVEVDSPEDQRKALLACITRIMLEPGIDLSQDCQILTPLNSKGIVSRKKLNMLLQNVFNPPRDYEGDCGQKVFRVRDKVICLQNHNTENYQFYGMGNATDFEAYEVKPPKLYEEAKTRVRNGEQGRVVAVHTKKRDVIIRLEDPTRFVRAVAPVIKKNDDDDAEMTEDGWTHAFAISIHKSQGSEWKHVIGIIDAAADRVASRECIYTLVSRAKESCILIGSRRTLARQIKNVENPNRKTFLKELILEKVEKRNSKNERNNDAI